MTIWDPNYEFKWKDLYYIVPAMVGFPPDLFWFLQIIISIIVLYFWLVI